MFFVFTVAFVSVTSIK